MALTFFYGESVSNCCSTRCGHPHISSVVTLRVAENILLGNCNIRYWSHRLCYLRLWRMSELGGYCWQWPRGAREIDRVCTNNRHETIIWL